jgi:adenylate kinase family enzyme
MPEIVIVLKCKEETTFARTIFVDQIKAEFNRIMDKRKTDSMKKRAEARKTEMDSKYEELKASADEESTAEKIQSALDEHMKEWDETDKEKADDEYLEEEPPVLQEMIEKQQEEARAQVEKDNAFIEEFVGVLKEKKVEVVENLNTDISAEYVHIKIVDKLKGHLKFRTDLIEREQARPLPIKEVRKFEQSYTYKHSKFGLNSPITPFNPKKTKEHAVLYRERIYFLSSRDEQQQFLLEPSKYVFGVESVPNDLLIKPKLCVLGLPKAGKSDLCEMLSKKIGVVHLRVEDMIEDIVTRESSFAHKIVDLLKVRGKEIDDLNIIQILSKRLERRDCREKGWVLEDFPKTRQQARMMAQRGIVPSNVFNLDMPIAEVYHKSENDPDFGCIRTILKKRLEFVAPNKAEVLYFYQKFYNSVTNIDGMKSRWFI